MSLTTKNHLSLVLQTIKKLLSFQADKSELATKIDRSEVEEEDAISVALTTDLIPSGIPLSEDGSIYTDENGVIYIL